MAASLRARALMLTAVTVAATGGAFVVLRPDAAPSPRARHQATGSEAATGDNPTLTQAGVISPTDGGAAAAPASGAAGPTGPGAAAPTAAAAATTTTTIPAGGTGKAPVGGQVTTSPLPSGAGGAAKPAKAPDEPGWRLLPKAPIEGRLGQRAVWTGREMVIWGGMTDLDANPLTDGAAFDPAAATWRKVPAAPLSPRFDATAVWTGREVLVFGGTSVDGDILADGAAWDPAAGTWRRLAASPLGARDGAVVAWTGDRLVVWGGATVPPPDAAGAPAAGDTPPASEMRVDGSAYVPATDSWVPVAAAPIPARSGAESVWTGTRLLISGGYHEGDDDDRTDGAAFDPVSGAWSPIAARPAPGSCGGDVPCDGVWTGTVALFPASGLAYDPAGDRWSAVAPYPTADTSLSGGPTVWTGQRLLAWGTPSGASGGDDSGAADSGTDASGSATDGSVTDSSPPDAPPPPPAGGMYDPAANRWEAVPAGPLGGRILHTTVWTGQEMLVWGGTAGDTGLADGAAFRPSK